MEASVGETGNCEIVKIENVNRNEGKTTEEAEIERLQVEEELQNARRQLENARNSLHHLKDIYKQRNEERLARGENVSFASMKKEYGAAIVKQADLTVKLGRLRAEVRSASLSYGFLSICNVIISAKLTVSLARSCHRSVEGLRGEVQQLRGGPPKGAAANPWQVGVPYGFRGAVGKDSKNKLSVKY